VGILYQWRSAKRINAYYTGEKQKSSAQKEMGAFAYKSKH
jgi:hypothetical protein